MAVTDQQVLDYLKANPGLSDFSISQKMDEFGVSPAQMAKATGVTLMTFKGAMTRPKTLEGTLHLTRR